MEEGDPPKINFVPCIRWVKRGIAKACPDKVELTEDELAAIIKETKTELDEGEREEVEAIKRNQPVNEEEEGSDEDEFDFAHYDEEANGKSSVLSFGNIVVNASTSEEPYITLDDDEDSEKEDDIIHPEDNLILVGHMEGDTSILEVYVYNEEEGSLYVHHDMMLPAFPLCIEWLGYEPQAQGTPANLCAVGMMSPVIQVWDLDIVNCLEAACKLGRKPNKKKGVKRVGHKDAVLDLAWNTIFPHILASGSVDRTVLLWDLDNCQPASKLSAFKEKVQALKWHPFESQTLLTGCCDGVAQVFDCRTEDSFKRWAVEGEVERVLWNHFDPFYFFVSTSEGKVHYIDCRSDTTVWQLAAHSKEVTGLSLSSQCPGMLVTASTDSKIKTWDIIGQGKTSAPAFVSEKNAGLGAVHCLEACPDLPYVYCAGGDNRSKNFGVWDLLCENSAVQQRFSSRELLQSVTVNPDADASQGKAEPMDTTCEAAEALESLSLEKHSNKMPTKKPFVKKKSKFAKNKKS